MPWLVDTGACTTLIGRHIWETMTDPPSITPTRIRITAAGGVGVEVIGEATLEVDFGPLVVPLRVIIAHVEQCGILGMDVMRAMETKIDVKRNLVFVRQEYAPDPSEVTPIQGLTYVSGVCIVKAGTRRLVTVRFSQGKSRCGIFDISSEVGSVDSSLATVDCKK